MSRIMLCSVWLSLEVYCSVLCRLDLFMCCHYRDTVTLSASGGKGRQLTVNQVTPDP